MGLEEGQYYLLVNTFGDENAYTQNYQVIPFRRTTPTKDPAQLLVTGIEAPEGETATGPYYCWFNIKAPNKDAVYGTYLTMDYDKYLNTVQYGTTAEQQIAAYIDQARFRDDAMAAINSDEGLNLCINAWDDTRYVLIAGVANEEEVLTATVGMNQTPPAEAEARTESNLFNELPGVWTLSGTSVQHQAETGEWIDYLRITTKTTLAAAPPMDDVPATLPEEVYQAYENANVARTIADAYFRDFKQTGTAMADKYRDHNRIVGCGMELGWGTGWGQTWSESAFRTPWNLFSASDYNGSGNMDIFRDYGPKYFLHVAPGDVITLQADSRTVGTASNYDRQMLIFASANEPEARRHPAAARRRGISRQALGRPLHAHDRTHRDGGQNLLLHPGQSRMGRQQLRSSLPGQRPTDPDPGLERRRRRNHRRKPAARNRQRADGGNPQRPARRQPARHPRDAVPCRECRLPASGVQPPHDRVPR